MTLPLPPAYRHYSEADNMTDAMAGLGALSDTDRPQRQQALDAFYARWKDDDLVINKWLGLQAASRAADALDRIKKVMDHEYFDIKNPNRVRALIGTFAHGNQLRFHNADGSGYEFVISRVLQIDPLNPQIAARLVTAFGNWQRFDQQRCDKIEAGLRTLLAADGLSKNVFEIADKILKSKPD